MSDWLIPLAITVATACTVLLAWRKLHSVSLWLAVGYPLKALHVYFTWGNVAHGCTLTRKRRRWRYTLDGLPVLGHASITLSRKRKIRRVDIDKPPRLGIIRPCRLGFRVNVKLMDGQTPDDYAARLSNLAHAWRVHSVRLISWKPGRVTLLATNGDPLATVATPVLSEGLLRVRVGLLETGAPWVLDFRTVPHWLNTGATQSGKSTLLNALITGLSAQPVALVGFDLKGGVELTSYGRRLSAIATERAECLGLLDDLICLVKTRMALCRTNKARNVWKLPEDLRPTPVVVLVDEVAELFLMAHKGEKDEIASTATALLRLAQLGRAFGVYLFVCGQRVGSDLGPGVTALRSQLSGRVCHRVNDPETATMTLGDSDPAALDAARQIPANMPGTAIVVGEDGRWYRARSVYVSEEVAEAAAQAHADLAPKWADLLTAADLLTVTDAELEALAREGEPT
ncbi:FtsK/SpoIIIE domain-containing protein [Nonomuraea wenchangensis]|uniref:DNA segregation ATPase FtsK/SpoIIIE, S-DNA-T family n=1 Tax=Nonomuraea wenchangensis TaxID=568860 RepID=A0A1I0LVS8_9ACTN|nr:FtsK/SpoIIIE domain-containing protein [Nonomuraea wenchangensis]SEU46090.1 DNA segregation ATPase FtsK/SpoIIIE, S-DNA-T family [Nonomuraea wenchangensis]